MSATIIDGKQVAASVTEAVKSVTTALEKDASVKPGLAVVIVGNDPASHAYVSSKSRMAKECGFASIQHTLPEATTQDELARLVETLNADETSTACRWMDGRVKPDHDGGEGAGCGARRVSVTACR